MKMSRLVVASREKVQQQKYERGGSLIQTKGTTTTKPMVHYEEGAAACGSCSSVGVIIPLPEAARRRQRQAFDYNRVALAQCLNSKQTKYPTNP